MPPPSNTSCNTLSITRNQTAPKPNIIPTKKIENCKDAKYFEHNAGKINEISKEYPKDIEMSFISGIPARLQYKPMANIIDSNKCVCRNIKLQIKYN